MLDAEGVAYRYRETSREPLSVEEVRGVLTKLGVRPRDVLRRRDKAYRELGLDGVEADEVLIAHMAEHPTLLQRPIVVDGDRAVVGRPVENVLELL